MDNPYAYRKVTWPAVLKLAAKIASNGGWRDTACNAGFGVYTDPSCTKVLYAIRAYVEIYMQAVL